MRGIIFKTELHAKKWDWEHNDLCGCVTRYCFPRKMLRITSTLSKAEYAELCDIPEFITDDEGAQIPNPRYEELEDEYVLNKCALCVGSALDTVDEEGNVTEHPDAVDIDDLLVEGGEGEV